MYPQRKCYNYPKLSQHNTGFVKRILHHTHNTKNIEALILELIYNDPSKSISINYMAQQCIPSQGGHVMSPSSLSRGLTDPSRSVTFAADVVVVTSISGDPALTFVV